MSSLNYYRMFFNYLKLLIFKKETLGKTAELMAVQRKDATFLYFEDDRISFDEFNRRSNRRANLFKSLGIGKGDIVCLMMDNRPEFLETLVGLGKLGAITAAINTNLKGSALIHSLTISGGKKAIVGAECLGPFKEAMAEEQCIAPSEVFVDTRWQEDAPTLPESRNLNELLADSSEENPPKVPLTSADLFMLIYTSGTTGMPKAARINHLRWWGAGLAFGWYAWEIRENDTIYCALPLYHSNGALLAFGSALRNGAALAISRRFSAGKYWEEVNKFGATCFIYIGEVLRYLVNSPAGPYDQNHKVTRILGNGLRPDIWETFQKRFNIPHIREFYASTEGNTYLINLNDVPGSVGQIVLKPSNLIMVRYDLDKEDYIRNEEGFCIPCAPGEVGELLGKIKGTTPFGGYTKAADTKKKILQDVFKKGDAFFKTGDLLKTDAAGNFFFIDRMGDTFRWKGENVSTHEVGEIITKYPGMAFANVYGVEIPGMEGKAGMAAITMKTGENFDPVKFFQYTEEKLASYAQPVFLRLKPEMEVTGTYKLTKTELKQNGFNPELVPDPIYFRDPQNNTYLLLEKPLFEKIQSGSIRL